MIDGLIDEGASEERSVVACTPFTFEVRVDPDRDTECDEITEDVAVTPLIVVVKVFPDRV